MAKLKQKASPPAFNKPLVKRANQRVLAFTRLAEIYAQRSRAESEPADLRLAVASQPKVSAGLSQAQGGLGAVVNALRAFDHPDAQAFIRLYDSITPTDRRNLSLEEIAAAADIGSSRLLGVSVEALVAYGRSISQVILWASMPQMVKRSVEAAVATGPEESLFDRQMMLKAAGFLPVPKGSTVAVQVNNQVPAPKDEPVRIWDPENQLRGIQDAWGEAKRLPAASVEHEPLAPDLESLHDRTTELTATDLNSSVDELLDGLDGE